MHAAMPTCKDSVPLPPYIRIPVAETSVVSGEPVSLTKDEIQELRSVSSLVCAVLSTLPPNITWRCDLVGAEMRLYLADHANAVLDASGETVDEFAMRFVEAHHAVARKLIENAALDRPLPESEAIGAPKFVDVLRNVQSVHSRSGREVVLVTSQGEHPLPVPSASDFTFGAKAQSVKQHRILQVVGLRRDDHVGHKLYLSEDEIAVRLPVCDRWAWPAIKDVLDNQTWFAGTLTRGEPRDPWGVGDDAALTSQIDAFSASGT
ncbi:MAG: hypothetical protein RL684_2468 [Pseudomonadota bacterium]